MDEDGTEEKKAASRGKVSSQICENEVQSQEAHIDRVAHHVSPAVEKWPRAF